MAFEIKVYESTPEIWNQFVENSNEGTIFHRLDFLNYHGDRFKANEYHLGIYKGTTLFGVMPLGIFGEGGKKIARSPFGASYGGPVFLKPLDYSDSKEIVEKLIEYLMNIHVQSCCITLPISCVYRTYSETFRLALLELGFKIVNRDISSVVNLSQNLPVEKIITSRARNDVRRAQSYGITIIENASVDEFYPLLAINYKKFETNPTHSLEELKLLAELFPSGIYMSVGCYQNQPVVGICNFVINKKVNSSFYLAQDHEQKHLQALSLLIYETLIESKQKGFEWYDFGLSSTKMQGQKNIFLYKDSFGTVGVFRDTYQWKG